MDSGDEWAVERVASALLTNDLLETVRRYGRLRRVTEYVLDNLASRATLTGAAAHAQMHPVSLSRYFYQKTGMRFGQFVRVARVATACQRLADGDCSISELARTLGYGNVSAFVRAFRMLKGCTPFRYRKAASRRPPTASQSVPGRFDVAAAP